VLYIQSEARQDIAFHLLPGPSGYGATYPRLNSLPTVSLQEPGRYC
jgi:hypothetical protein